MYAYIFGVDEHFVFKRLSNRKEAEEWLKSEMFLYNICYEGTNPDYGIMSDREFKRDKVDQQYELSVEVRRLGDKLLERIEEFDNKYK